MGKSDRRKEKYVEGRRSMIGIIERGDEREEEKRR
jgi:hypothetical protein